MTDELTDKQKLANIINEQSGIEVARDLYRKAFENDPGLRMVYMSRVAVLLYDRLGVTDQEQRTKVADEILQVLF
jgi:hypothetical protein